MARMNLVYPARKDTALISASAVFKKKLPESKNDINCNFHFTEGKESKSQHTGQKYW